MGENGCNLQRCLSWPGSSGPAPEHIGGKQWPCRAETPREELLPPAPHVIYLTASNSSLVNISRQDWNSGCKAQDSFFLQLWISIYADFCLYGDFKTLSKTTGAVQKFLSRGKGPAYTHSVILVLISRIRKLHLCFCFVQSDKNSSCSEKANRRTAINNNVANTALLRVVSNSS